MMECNVEAFFGWDPPLATRRQHESLSSLLAGPVARVVVHAPRAPVVPSDLPKTDCKSVRSRWSEHGPTYFP